MPYQSSRFAISLRTIILAILLLPGLLTGNAAYAQETPANVIASDGVDISVIGMDTATVDGAGTHLTLERVTVQPDAVVEPQAPGVSALVVLQRGAVLAVDERGFISRMEAPSEILMPAGSATSWTASDEVMFLRLSLTEKPPAPVAAEGVNVEVLASLVMSQPPSGDTQLFVATATLAPDMASVRVDHSGTTGLLVDAGTVEVLSPSGLEGQLQAGASIIFTQSAPLNLLGTAGTDASALLFGITDAPEPASVVASSIVDVCRNKDARACTPTGSILANGEAWLHPDASLTVNATTAGTATWVTNTSMTVELMYEHRGDEPVEFSADPKVISVAYDNGQAWTLESGGGHTFSLQPNESDTMTLTFAPPEGAGEGNVVITVSEFGAVSDARWQGVVELLTFTPPGATLAFGETWVGETARVTLDVRQATSDESNQPERDVALDITYTNTGAEAEEFVIAPSRFFVRHNGGSLWTATSSLATTVRIEPGESRTFTLLYREPVGRSAGDISIETASLGGAEDLQWAGPNPMTE